MATINDLILKSVSGKLGRLVFRRMNGKTIVYARTGKYKLSKQPQCVALRHKFTSVVKFAKFLNDIPKIKLIWKNAKIEGRRAYNRAFKFNFKLMNVSNPTINNMITPLPCHFFIEDVILMENNIAIIMDEQFTASIGDIVILIMAIYNPINAKHNEFELLDISSSDSQNISIELTPEQTIKLMKYKNFILYTAIMRNENNNVQWSNTMAIEGEIEKDS